MNTKTLTPRALSVIDQYLHFKFGAAVCAVPYFNNKTVRARAALRALIGKGSPKDILEEIQTVAVKNRVPADSLADESLKKLLTDNNLGIDCSAFAYYVLDAESQELKKGSLDKHIHFINCKGMLGKVRAALRPVENCDVATLADNKNSSVVSLKDVQPGCIVTMTGDTQESERDHVLVVHQVEYQNFVPIKIHYSHAVAYPEDGVYGTGVKQGSIEITDINGPITSGVWSENGSTENAKRIFARVQKSKTELKKLNWM